MNRKNLTWPRRILNWRLLIFINLAVLTLFIVNIGREWLQNKEVRSEFDKLKEEAEKLTKRSTDLQKVITELQSVKFLESEARLRLGLVRPGETSVVIHNLQEMGAKDSDRGAKEKTNPQKWWSYFFDAE